MSNFRRYGQMKSRGGKSQRREAHRREEEKKREDQRREGVRRKKIRKKIESRETLPCSNDLWLRRVRVKK